MSLGIETIIMSYSLVTLAIYMITLYIGLIPSLTHPLQENVKCVELRLVMLRIVSQNLSVIKLIKLACLTGIALYSQMAKCHSSSPTVTG